MAKISGIHTQRVEKIVLSSGNGFGSTNTAIRRFNTTKLTTLSNLLAYTDSATLGSSFTALKKVHIVASYCDVTNSGQSPTDFGCAWSLNTTQPSTAAGAVTDGSLVGDGMIRVENVNSSMKGGATAVYSGTLEIGDVLRPHGDTDTTSTNSDSRTLLSIVVTEIPV